MDQLPIDVVKSFHYSRVRTRVFFVLAEHGPQYPAALARAARVDMKTLGWAMVGRPPRYHKERALVRLGLVRAVEDRNGRYYELTVLGRRIAAHMAIHGVPRS